MNHDLRRLPVHPAGGQPPIEQETALTPATLDTWAGPVRVEWDPTAPLTPYGQLPFFIEFLKVASLFDALVADCPLAYRSPNKPEKRDVLVVRFRHLHPLAARSRANAGIIRTTSNIMILVELLNLTFESELAAGGTQTSNSLH